MKSILVTAITKRCFKGISMVRLHKVGILTLNFTSHYLPSIPLVYYKGTFLIRFFRWKTRTFRLQTFSFSNWISLAINRECEQKVFLKVQINDILISTESNKYYYRQLASSKLPFNLQAKGNKKTYFSTCNLTVIEGWGNRWRSMKWQ